MTADNSDTESTEHNAEDPTEGDGDESTAIPRRSALGLLGLTGLLALGGQSIANAPEKVWKRDQDAEGNNLYRLGALTMDANSSDITDFEGDGLEIVDSELTIDFDALPDDVAQDLSAVGRYLAFDDGVLNFTGAAEWENTHEEASNVASGTCAVVAGGMLNEATGDHSTTGGGERNSAEGETATIGGGHNNNATGNSATIAGGEDNTAEGAFGAVGGGAEVTAAGNYAVGSGGLTNDATGTFSAISGGLENDATGHASTVPGGSNNVAVGRYSVAAGREARASHDGAFVFGNSSGTEVESETEDEIRFQGGGGFVIEALSSGDGAPLTYDSDTGELRVDHSSARYKENIEPLQTDPEAVLELEPRSFEYTDSEREGIGLIAEEVAERVPELAITDSDGRPDAVRYDRLGIYLIPEVRRQREENAELRERIATLEERIDEQPAPSDGDSVEGDD